MCRILNLLAPGNPSSTVTVSEWRAGFSPLQRDFFPAGVKRRERRAPENNRTTAAEFMESGIESLHVFTLKF